MENVEKKQWHTDDPNIFLIGGRKIVIVKKGREQAVQIEKYNKWLSENFAPQDSIPAGDNTVAGWEMFKSLLNKMTADAQIELAEIFVGAKDADGAPINAKEFLYEHYALDWVTDAVSIFGQTASVQRLMTAFFTNIG